MVEEKDMPDLKQENDNKETNEQEATSGFIKKSTFWWIVSILSALFLGAVTCILVGLNDTEKVMSYVGAFSVLLSILLSIFAIQYTYHSNNEVYRQFDKINGCAENINGTNQELSATHKKLDNHIDTILTKLDSIQADLRSSVNSNRQSGGENKTNDLNRIEERFYPGTPQDQNT